MGGVIIISLQDHQNALALRQKGAYRIMCIGESTTQGQYPIFLKQALDGRNRGIRFSVIDRGIKGSDSSLLVDRLESDLDAYHPAMVVAMMGINDNGRHMSYAPEMNSKIVRCIRTLKTYKLARIAWQHATNTGRGAGDAPHHAAARGRTEPKPKGKIAEEQGLRTARPIDRKIEWAYPELEWSYLKWFGTLPAPQKILKKPSLQKLLRKSLKENPASADRMYGALGMAYVAMDDPILAQRYHELAEGSRRREYDPVVADNYRRLKGILDRRGVKLVCVQYPMRGLEPLRKMFQGRDDGIIFVDNENIFRDAVKRSSLQEYFLDLFAGDFGHCTDKGNRLLAGNIADVLSREVFGR